MRMVVKDQFVVLPSISVCVSGLGATSLMIVDRLCVSLAMVVMLMD